jgi:AAA domain-containing protein
MIKLESIHIEEVRGIRKLDLDFQKEKFAICGPNGSGKSGVIDAIEFGLTELMGRLTGRGTKGLSVSEHGPHVDKVKFPDAAFVELKVYLTELGKSATITRKISSPKKPKIDPPGADVKAALAEIADHPEITLSRRDILRFILVEPTKRSEEIQALLKLDEIGQTRSALNAAQNRLQAAHATATGATHWSSRALAARTGLSQSTVSRIWRAFGLRPHRSETFQLSNDPLLVDKARDIVGLYMNPPHHALVLCVDEKSQIQALSRSQPILPMLPGQVERGTHDYKRHGTTSLFAALDITTGSAIGKCWPRHRAIEFRKFLNQIDRAVPADLTVHLVLTKSADAILNSIGRFASRTMAAHSTNKYVRNQ